MAVQAFRLSAPGDIRFGDGVSLELGKTARAFGTRAFVVTGRDRNRHAAALRSLEEAGMEYETHPARAEPGFGDLREALAAARRFMENGRGGRGPGFDIVVIGLGGGSALDVGKATAILLGNEGDPLEYAEGGEGSRSFSLPGAPFIALPTTSGTGSEVTRNAVFANEATGAKVSLRSPLMTARAAMVDPSLTWGLGPGATAAGGLDALTQVLEPFTCRRPNPVTDALCREALARAMPALRASVAAAARGGEPADAEKAARSDMSFVSLCGGLALANAGLGAVHGIAGPLGGRFAIPHGVACGIFLGPVTEANVRALRERDPGNPAMARYALAARLITGSDETGPDDLGPLLSALPRELGVAPLGSWGIRPADAPALAAACLGTNGMRSNCVELGAREVEGIFARAFGAGPGA